MKPLYTFLPAKAIPFWKNFPKNRRFPSGGGADAGGCTEMAARTRGRMHSWRRGRGGMHSGGGADAGGCAAMAARTRGGRCAETAAWTRGGCTAMAARMHRSAACRGPPCPSSARGPPCPSSAAARHARHPHAARHAHHPPRPAVRRPVCANEKSPARGAGRFFRCCAGAGAYAPRRAGEGFSDVARALTRRLRARPAA